MTSSYPRVPRISGSASHHFAQIWSRVHEVAMCRRAPGKQRESQSWLEGLSQKSLHTSLQSSRGMVLQRKLSMALLASRRLPMQHALRQHHWMSGQGKFPMCQSPMSARIQRLGPRHWERAQSSGLASEEEEMDVDEIETRRFLSEEAGYGPEIVDGIVRALQSPSSGIPKGKMTAIVCSLAGRLEVGEDAGLEVLAKSVEMDLKERIGKEKVSFHVKVPHVKQEFKVQGFEGMSLRDIAQHGRGHGAEMLREVIECACSGVMACSTCHVIVDPEWFDKVGHPTEEEQDMIDLAFDPQDTSRLGCQIELAKAMEGFVVTIPAEANNLFDHIPFDDK